MWLFDLRRTPAHQGIIPTLSVIEFDLPHIYVISTTLHCILWWYVNTYTSCFNVFFRHAAYLRYVHLQKEREREREIIDF